MTSEPTTAPGRREDERADDERDDDVGRINALTDGVIAIAITLLALDLKPDLPTSTSSHRLLDYLHHHLGPYIAFVIAFFVIAQYWVLHRRIMSRVRRSSPAMLRVTLVFLFAVTFAPVTAFLNGDLGNDLAVTLFAANVLVMGGCMGALAEIVHRQRLDGGVEGREQRVRRRARSVGSLVIPALVAGLAWVIGPHAGYLYLLFLPLSRTQDLVWWLVSRRTPAAP
ncbi:TMEM175 family protein [uncultured Jatrophihabitans sp.]|uniref:TMEM175 family protein n=1 Tax=uncultured Jatrophihabitans sp. TaxID=1610747 RepID=UPI0035CA8E60